MDLVFIRTKKNTWLVDLADDEIRDKMGIVFGKASRLFSEKVVTDSNEKGVWKYSSEVSENDIQVCHKDQIVERRVATQIEEEIYKTLLGGEKLTKEMREFLRKNYYIGIEEN